MSAGAAWLYSCKEKAASISLTNMQITGADEELLAELTETILPKTDFPGANDLKTSDFIFVMVDDCAGPAGQTKFAAGLKAFSDAGFVKMSPEERRKFIDGLEGGNKEFFEGVKEGVITNFTTSKEYLEKVKNITNLIPPKFRACVPVNS